MEEQEDCRRQTLARNHHFRVDRCGCGMYHITLGAVTVRLAPDAYEIFCLTVVEAWPRQAERALQ